MAITRFNEPDRRRTKRLDEKPYRDTVPRGIRRNGKGLRGRDGESYYSEPGGSEPNGYAPRAETYSTQGAQGAQSAQNYAQQNSSGQANGANSGGSAGSANSGSGGSSNSSSGGSANGAYSDFYDKLAAKLRSYGVNDIPAYSELYGLFESFLRPAVEEAIRAREKRSRTNSAEIDADAYARGMGGSSYISSMKQREKADSAADIAALEGKYTASMAEYLYKAVSAMQQLEAELAKTRMTLAAQKQMNDARVAATYASIAARNAGGSGRSGKSGKSGKTGKSGKSGSAAEEFSSKYGHNKKGSYFDGKWYEGDFSYLKKKYSYSDYANYLSSLSKGDRYLFFTSSSREWRIRRWQVQYNLAEVDYRDLVSAYMPLSPYGTNHGGYNNGPGGGGGKWLAMPY